MARNFFQSDHRAQEGDLSPLNYSLTSCSPLRDGLRDYGDELMLGSPFRTPSRDSRVDRNAMPSPLTALGGSGWCSADGRPEGWNGWETNESNPPIDWLPTQRTQQNQDLNLEEKYSTPARPIPTIQPQAAPAGGGGGDPLINGVMADDRGQDRDNLRREGPAVPASTRRRSERLNTRMRGGVGDGTAYRDLCLEDRKAVEEGVICSLNARTEDFVINDYKEQHGLFTRRVLVPGHQVGEYEGETTDDAEHARRYTPRGTPDTPSRSSTASRRTRKTPLAGTTLASSTTAANPMQ